MKHFLLGLFMFGAGAVNADTLCDELWYTKNLLFDRAGHCFSSALGRANFDNGDCIGANPTLRPIEQRQFDAVVAMEENWQCEVDTTEFREIPIRQRDLRAQMIILPIKDGMESGCIGYRGPEVALRAGPAETAPQTGTLRAGDDIGLPYSFEGDWAYVNLDGDSGAGWAMLGQTNYTELCEMFAG